MSAPLPRPLPASFSSDIIAAAHFACSRFSPTLPVVLVGHSLGGALVARAAGEAWPPAPALRGVVVFDFVGAAAAPAAQAALLGALPRAFPSAAAAAAWAAAASVESGCATGGGGHAAAVAAALVAGEGDGDLAWGCRAALDAAADPAALAAWLGGASDAFLAARCPKLLLLASAGSLSSDKALTVASMQGKFQVKVVAAGHWMHEEAPELCAAALAGFLGRV